MWASDAVNAILGGYKSYTNLAPVPTASIAAAVAQAAHDTLSALFPSQQATFDQALATDKLEGGVWQDVCSLLTDPQRMQQEVERRLSPAPETEREAARLADQIGRLKAGLGRVIDSVNP